MKRGNDGRLSRPRPAIRAKRACRGVMHLGIVVILLGVAVHQGTSTSAAGNIAQGGSAELAGYTVELYGLTGGYEPQGDAGGDAGTGPAGAQYLVKEVSASLRMVRDGRTVASGRPVLLWDGGDGAYVARPFVATVGIVDYYMRVLSVEMGNGNSSGVGGPPLLVDGNATVAAVEVELRVNPGVPLLWLGMALSLGGSFMLLMARTATGPDRSIECPTDERAGGSVERRADRRSKRDRRAAR